MSPAELKRCEDLWQAVATCYLAFSLLIVSFARAVGGDIHPRIAYNWLMLWRTVHLATVVFWTSVPLLGMAMILPWLRIDWLLVALAVPVVASAAVLVVLTSSPGYVSPASLSKDVERVVYALAFIYAMGTIAY